MTDGVEELRCSDCNGIFVDGKVFHLIGGVNINPYTTVEEEIHHEYDGGNLCVVCYNYKISLLQKPSTKI